MTFFAKHVLGAVVCLLVTAPAAMASRLCDDLWFTRNWVMDQAGYCFGSVLGQAQFDNADCTSQQVTLTSEQSALVADIQQRERMLGCAVNTRQGRLDMPDIAVRKRLQRQPVRHAGDNMEGWGCLGYVGPSVALHTSPSAGAAQIGRIDAGDWVGVGGHETINGWIYVTTHNASWSGFRSGGWMPLDVKLNCESEAG